MSQYGWQVCQSEVCQKGRSCSHTDLTPQWKPVHVTAQRTQGLCYKADGSAARKALSRSHWGAGSVTITTLGQ